MGVPRDEDSESKRVAMHKKRYEQPEEENEDTDDTEEEE